MTEQEFKTTLVLLGFTQTEPTSRGTKYRFKRGNIRVYAKPNNMYFIAGLKDVTDRSKEETLKVLKDHYD